jgi:hypothetical protein
MFTPTRRRDAWSCSRTCAQRARRRAQRAELGDRRPRRQGPVGAYIPTEEEYDHAAQ